MDDFLPWMAHRESQPRHLQRLELLGVPSCTCDTDPPLSSPLKHFPLVYEYDLGLRSAMAHVGLLLRNRRVIALNFQTQIGLNWKYNIFLPCIYVPVFVPNQSTVPTA